MRFQNLICLHVKDLFKSLGKIALSDELKLQQSFLNCIHNAIYTLLIYYGKFTSFIFIYLRYVSLKIWTLVKMATCSSKVNDDRQIYWYWSRTYLKSPFPHWCVRVVIHNCTNHENCENVIFFLTTQSLYDAVISQLMVHTHWSLKHFSIHFFKYSVFIFMLYFLFRMRVSTFLLERQRSL